MATKRKSELPEVLPVRGTDWEVHEDSFDPEDADTVGYTDVRDQSVTVYTEALKKFPKQGPARKVLLHESVHISLIAAGLDELLGEKMDEAVCRAVEEGLWPLIQAGVFQEG